MRKLLVLLTPLLVLSLIVGAVGCDEEGQVSPTLDQSQTSTPGNTGLEGDWWLSQGFIPSMPILTSVEVYVGSVNANLSYPLTLQIRGDSNGLPSGTVLASTSVTIAGKAWEWITFDLPDLSVNPGARYYLVLSSVSNYHVGLDSTNPYPHGCMAYSTDAGTAWTTLHDNPNYDMAFRIHGIPLEEAPTPTPTAPPTPDVTGTWSGNWWRSDGGEEGTLIATLTQSVSSLSGDMTFTSTTYSYSQDTTISGSVEGNDVVFGMAIGGNGEIVTIDYDGTVSEDGNQMMGTYSMSTGYTGTWSVTRTIITPTTTPTITTPTTTPTITTPTTTTPATTTPSPTTTTPTGEDIAVLSSNVFTRTSSILLDGESRRLHIVAELRNDSNVDMDLGHIYFHFYNASGEVVCKRWAYAFDDILPLGGTTVVEETVPSQIYWDSETNDFPDDWVRYEITINAQPASGTRKPVEVTIQNVEVTVTSTGGLEVTGSVLNSSQETVKNVKPYVILYASDGTILNADRASGISELQSGESQNFECRILADEPIDYAHYVVRAYAEKF